MATRLSKDIKRSSSPSHARKPSAAAPGSGPMAVSIDTSATAHMSAATAADARMLTPPPSSARTELAMRIGDFSMNSPIAERGSGYGGDGDRYANAAASNVAAASPDDGKGYASLHAGSAFFAQNRAILLSGLPQSPASKESQSPSPDLHPRHGLPLPPSRHRHLTPLVTVNSAPEQYQQHHPQHHPQHQQYHHHHHHPHSAIASAYSPLQSPRTISPCVYVNATSLLHRHRHRHRRSSSAVSSAVSTTASSSVKTKGSGGDATATAASAAPSDASLTPPPEGRLFVSAYIVPAHPDKPPFSLRREFDLQELLDAVPRPDRRRLSSVSILPSPGLLRSPLSSSAMPSLNASSSSLHRPPLLPPAPPPPTPVTATAAGMKRPASDHHLPHTPASPHPSLHRHIRQRSQTEELQSPSPSDQFLASGAIPIPIRPHPSLGGLPGLAAIILSRRVEAGDMIELPLPHPEAWSQTVSYVYRSRGDLTEEVKRNIEHLGGNCD